MATRMPWTDEETKFVLDNLQAAATNLRDVWERSNRRHSLSAYRCKYIRELDALRQTPGDGPRIDSQGGRIQRLGKVADLLERSGIDPDDVGKVSKVRLKEWQGMYKDNEGDAHVVDMEGASIVLSPKWAEGPAWPVVTPGPAIHVKPRPASKNRSRVPDGMKVAVVLPDLQIGYWRDSRDILHPTHDESAMDLALQIMTEALPDQVIMLGDNLDFPELSRYRKEPAFQRTVQPTIDRAVTFLADIRANTKTSCEIDWMEGNHEVRLANYIKDNACAAFGIKPGNMPGSWPVLSVPVLCRLDELGVSFHAGYPAKQLWLSDRLTCIHGDKAKATGNARGYLDEERASTIFAHTHRREWEERTRTTRHGPRTIMAANPGTLCRIDGAVPSKHSGHELDGEPVVSWENWQQGMAVLTYTPGDGPFSYEPIPIHHGVAFYRGRRYESTVDVEGRSIEGAA